MTHPNDVAVGIVGLGGIGTHHATKLVERGANLVGGMDIDADARVRFHEEFDIPAYEDEAALYDACDAVLITTPNRFHEEYATSALEAGLDVLLEKPLAHTLESAERIAEAARAAEGFCMVGFNNRFADPVRVIKHYQDEGRFGETTHVEANYVRRRGVPGRGSWFTSSEVAGGGALIDIGVHAIDLALYFLDHPEVVEVSGETRSEFGGRDDYAYVHMWGDDAGPEGFDVDDSASAFIRGAGGSTVSLEVAWATNRRARRSTAAATTSRSTRRASAAATTSRTRPSRRARATPTPPSRRRSSKRSPRARRQHSTPSRRDCAFSASSTPSTGPRRPVRRFGWTEPERFQLGDDVL